MPPSVRKMCGRTFRRRKQKKINSSDLAVDYEDFYRLTKWMCLKGFKSSKKLQLKMFKETGRGLMTDEVVKQGDIIISIPEHLLITPTSVLNSYLGNYFKKHFARATGQEILSVFLMCECAKAETSDWYPYISSLPKKYSIPAYFCQHLLNIVPNPIKKPAISQCESVKISFKKLETLFKELENTFPAFRDSLNYEHFKWAWSTVNTRCIFMKCLECCPGEECTYHLALAPLLDLLNHSVDVQVTAGFNRESNQYEIISHNHFKKYSQVFINYGNHDNLKLFIEYGFITDYNNNDFITFPIDDILLAYKMCNFSSHNLKAKLKFIQDNNLLRNAVCSKDGISWNLLIILKILASDYDIKLWNTLIHSVYNKKVTNKDFKSLKKVLLKLKIKDYAIEESCIKCSECSIQLYSVHKLASIFNDIVINALS